MVASIRPARRSLRPVMFGLLLLALTVVAHSPAFSAGFVWDDDLFLTENPLIRANDGLYRFWFTTDQADYFPLTSSLLWVEWRIWGRAPLPYHAGNVALHAVAAFLLWRVLRRLDIGESVPFLAAMLFAVHPVTVASVAWITERKNVLSMPLYLASILCFLRFTENGRGRAYVLALLAGVAAALAKASVVMLPVVLLLLLLWKRRRLERKDVAAVLPFFLISLVLGLITIWFQHDDAMREASVRPEGPASRIAASGWIVWFYLSKAVLPIHLIMVYPRWSVDGASVVSFLPLLLLILGFVGLWAFRGRGSRGLLFALGYFVIALVPVLGFVDMWFMAHSLVSDHLQYVALPGATVAVAGLLAKASARAGRRYPRRGAVGFAAAGGVVVAALTILTWLHTRTFRDEETLWSRTIRLNPRAWVAYNNRGNAYNGQGRWDEAIRDLERALALKPGYAVAHCNLGIARVMRGEIRQGLAEYNLAIELSPGYAEAYANRGNAYRILGDYDRAIEDCTLAMDLNPDAAGPCNTRGIAWGAKGDYQRAIEDFTRAISLNRDFADAYGNRAVAWFHRGAYEAAWADVAACRQLGTSPPAAFLRALTEASGRSE